LRRGANPARNSTPGPLTPSILYARADSLACQPYPPLVGRKCQAHPSEADLACANWAKKTNCGKGKNGGDKPDEVQHAERAMRCQWAGYAVQCSAVGDYIRPWQQQHCQRSRAKFVFLCLAPILALTSSLAWKPIRRESRPAPILTATTTHASTSARGPGSILPTSWTSVGLADRPVSPWSLEQRFLNLSHRLRKGSKREGAGGQGKGELGQQISKAPPAARLGLTELRYKVLQPPRSALAFSCGAWFDLAIVRFDARRL
jgi:hypothetical protein